MFGKLGVWSSNKEEIDELKSMMHLARPQEIKYRVCSHSSAKSLKIVMCSQWVVGLCQEGEGDKLAEAMLYGQVRHDFYSKCSYNKA